MSLAAIETRIATACWTQQEAGARVARLGPNEFKNALVLGLAVAASVLPCFSQNTSDLQTFFRQDIGLSPDQIAAIQKGEPFAKLRSHAAQFLEPLSNPLHDLLVCRGFTGR